MVPTLLQGCSDAIMDSRGSGPQGPPGRACSGADCTGIAAVKQPSTRRHPAARSRCSSVALVRLAASAWPAPRRPRVVRAAACRCRARAAERREAASGPEPGQPTRGDSDARTRIATMAETRTRGDSDARRLGRADADRDDGGDSWGGHRGHSEWPSGRPWSRGPCLSGLGP